MLFSYKWLQSFFDEELPSAEEVADKLTFGAFEIEGIEERDGDKIIDVDVLPNRASDSLSHNGIAREISTLTGISLKHKPLEISPILSPRLSKELVVTINDEMRCPVYTAVLIRGVKVGPSPDWIKEALEAIGQKSINNIVDATNYILFGMGQPLHAFDAKKFTEKDSSIGIGVRPAKNGEKIIVLGGDEYELTNEMTVITDGNSDEAIAIAGVKGGAGHEVDENTVDIVIESAKFNPVVTRKTAQALNLRTDASKRFENEVPNEFPFYGIEIVVELIQKIAGGELIGYAGTEPKESKPYILGISADEVNKVLGTNLSESDVRGVLDKLGFKYEKLEDPIAGVLKIAKTLEGKPYKYGASVSSDAPECFDCSSLISWLFAQVGVSVPRVSVDQYLWGDFVDENDIMPGDVVFSNTNVNHVWYESKDFLPGQEVSEGVDHCGLYIGDGKVLHAAGSGGTDITNGTETRDVGKVVIEEFTASDRFGDGIVGYRRMMDSNINRFVVNVPFERLDLRISADLIEEIGRVYGYKNIKGESLSKSDEKLKVNKKHYFSEKIRNALTSIGFTEVLTYSLKNKGEVALLNALASDKDHLRSNLSDSVSDVLEQNNKNAPLLGLYDAVNIFEIGNVFTKNEEESHVCIVSTKKDEIEKAKKIIKNTLGVEPEFKEAEAAVELNLSGLLEKLPPPDSYEKISNIAQDAVFKPISQYPFVLRDIAVWVPESTTSDVVIEVISKNSGDLLVREDMFDVYKKDGKVSYAFHLVFQATSKTLTDAEVNSIMKKVETELIKREWEIR
jgi:phenylalanyl-tRNA synthetase beta subunit